MVEEAYVLINNNRNPDDEIMGKFHEKNYNDFSSSLVNYHEDYKGKDIYSYNLPKLL